MAFSPDGRLLARWASGAATTVLNEPKHEVVFILATTESENLRKYLPAFRGFVASYRKEKPQPSAAESH